MIDDPLIFDVGMHIGQDTAFYLAKGFRVVAVEANPSLVKEAEHHFADALRREQLTILNVGIGDKDGTLPFYVNAKYSEWSSFDKELGSREGGYSEVIEVPVIPFEQLVERFGTPYYLKIDIEGYDHAVLQHLALCAARPRYLSVENGWPDMLHQLVALGYMGFKFINQAKVQEMRCPMPSREGRSVDWVFPWSSSGPFGEDTPGAWNSREEILIEIKAYWDNPTRDANVHGWYDLHARHGLA